MGSQDAASSLAARWSLHGHTALVTGGSRGIGKAIVEELAGLGASVYMCCRTASHLEESLKQWKAAGLNVQGSICDVSSRDSRIQLMQNVSRHFEGKLDILVNNVGCGGRIATVDVTPEMYAFVMSTNLESCFHLSQLAHPLLKASGRGRIVFVSSILGQMTSDLTTTMAISKAGMNQLARSLASEWASDGILVNAMAPGAILTDLTVEVGKGVDLLKDIPLGRAGAQPTEAAAGVVFFCLPCSSFCTGQILTLDGGTSVRPVFSRPK